jgi:polyhydroxybutyrate depolymerase
VRNLATIAVLTTFIGAITGASAAAESTEREIVVDGVTRSYLIHVPGTWDRVRPIPVLFVFHGAGSDAESMVRATGFDGMAAGTNMIVVYPRAPSPVLRYEVDPPAGRDSADVRLVDALLERLRARFPVDARRIWATGFSNGAAFCYRLAAERPRVIAAIAPVAGYLPRLTRGAGAVPIPLLHVHGGEDGRVRPPGSPGTPGQSIVQTWAEWNGATPTPSADKLPGTGTLDVRRTAWRGPTPRSDAQLLLVQGEGHTWSGGPAGPISRAILEFLVAHPQDESKPAPLAEGGPVNPLVGQPFGSMGGLRWLTPEGGPVSLAAQRLTLFRWWTNGCPHCTGSVPALARLEERYRARGLRLVGVYHPKGAALGDAAARDYARGLGFTGAIAFDDRWAKYGELRDRGGLHRATSISVLVDADGVVRWVHPGPRIEAGSADLAALEAFLDRSLPR